MSTETKALEKKKPSAVERVRTMLEDHTALIKRVAANRVNPDQLVSVAIQCMTSNPLLMKCDPRTIAGALVNASRLGLVPDPALRQCGLVPRWNKHLKGHVCHLWIQVGGWVQLVKRAGENIVIEAHTVRQHDEFDYEFGTSKYLRHKITKPRSERGEFTHTYAIAYFPSGASQFHVMDKEDVERIREKSDAKDGPFWTNWYEEMAQAKAGKALCKWLQISNEQVQLAVGLDDQMDANVHQTSPIDTPTNLQQAAEQVVETKVAKAEQASEGLSEIDQDIIPVAVQQAVMDGAHLAGVTMEAVAGSLRDIQLEALNAETPEGQKAFVKKCISELLNVYANQQIARERQRQSRKPPSAVEQAKAPAPAEEPPPATVDHEHPWMTDAEPVEAQEPAPEPKQPATPSGDSTLDELGSMFD